MASDIDEKLIKCKILDKLKLNSKKYIGIKESKNLIATFEQHLFVWHDAGSCILATEISNNELEEKMKKFAINSKSEYRPKDPFYKVMNFFKVF